jgi:hypothetical protein
VAHRSVLAVLVAAFLLALAPAASAQLPPPFFAFEHDSTRDGTPNEVVSGFYGGDDGDNSNGDPLADRVPNSYEYFDFTVPEGSEYGSFNVHVEWADPRIDLDVYVYRLTPGGDMVSNNVASSASFGDNDEDAGHRPAVGNVRPDTYRIVVDNWCSSPTDPGSSPAACGFATEIPNEDDFSGEVRFGGALISNPLPTVILDGPASGTTLEPLTFTANATDDEPIENYAFDFNNDGRFETDNLRSNVVSHRFESAGVYDVGVRVTDRDGDRAFATKEVTIRQVAGTIVRAAGLLSSFKLNRPVFGGRKNRKLVVRYRLREAGRVIVSLYRGKRRISRMSSGNRVANRTYKITINPRRLRRGSTYTVRLFVRSADGTRVQRARLSAKRL